MEKLSKFLSLVLRHKPEAIGITLDEYGYANVNDLIVGMSDPKYSDMIIDSLDIEEVVISDNKSRYSYNVDKTKIRANQGHSIKVNLNLVPITGDDLPVWLYHGTNSRFVEAIMKEGLKPMNRHHVHLACEIHTAKDVGDRRKKAFTETKIFKISTIEMVNDGYEFYKSENGVFLTDTVPPKYLR